jgi:hypothetical protein
MTETQEEEVRSMIGTAGTTKDPPHITTNSSNLTIRDGVMVVEATVVEVMVVEVMVVEVTVVEVTVVEVTVVEEVAAVEVETMVEEAVVEAETIWEEAEVVGVEEVAGMIEAILNIATTGQEMTTTIVIDDRKTDGFVR